jgi:hypothetical protein
LSNTFLIRTIGFYTTSEAFARNLKRTVPVEADNENINPKWLCLEDKNGETKVENKPATLQITRMRAVNGM